MTGAGDATLLGTDATAAAEAARRLRELGRGRPLVAVKRGPDGALAIDSSGSLIEVPAYGVDAVDTVGAGDAFDAGFLAGWLDGRPVRDCLAWGVACGALSTRAVGGTAGQATRGELEAALTGWSPG
jgi:sugar/nucleoside kinase (ribokinase family)